MAQFVLRRVHSKDFIVSFDRDGFIQYTTDKLEEAKKYNSVSLLIRMLRELPAWVGGGINLEIVEIAKVPSPTYKEVRVLGEG